MTWVLGIPGVGASLLMGDRQVSRRNGQGFEPVSAYGVRKIHALNPFMTVGFAGPVLHGFRAIEFMRLSLPHREEREWDPLPAYLVDFVSKCQHVTPGLDGLKMVCVATRDIGMLPTLNDRGFALTEGRAWSLDIQHNQVTERNLQRPGSTDAAFASIGSGSTVRAWEKVIMSVTSDPNYMAEAYSPTRLLGDIAIAQRVGFDIERAMHQELNSTEKDLVSATVGRELEMLVMTDSGVTPAQNGESSRPLATNLDEYVTFAEKQNHEVEAVVA